jgi:hypothetical protein
MSRNIASALFAMVLFFAVTAGGQDVDSLAAQYGRGVHAYFSGDYAKARRELTHAIDGGSQDPRCHYFRALALAWLGEADKVEADMARGAELEVLDRDGFYPVSRSLERVQGRNRLLLESHRQQAREVASQRALEYNRSRYEQLRRAEGEVLRRPLRVPLENLAEDLSGSPAVPVAPDGNVPLGPPSLPGSTAAAEPPEADGNPDPFAMPSEPAAPAAGGKVKAKTLGRVLVRIFRRSFGAVSGESGQAPDAVDAGMNDLFDDGAATDADALFGEDPATVDDEAAPADGDDPFADDAPVEDPDPFGEAAPAEEDDDIFGDDEPVEEVPGEGEPDDGEPDDGEESSDEAADDLFGP